MPVPTAHEREVLRALAGRVRQIADHPVMQERKSLWYDHNALRSRRPMILCFPEGAWGELMEGVVLECQDPQLRDWERALRGRIYWWEHINDDNTVEPWFDLNWRVSVGDYGVKVPYTHGEDRGSYVWDPPIKDIASQLPSLHYRPLSVDREGTQRDLALAHDLFGDLLPPRIRGGFWWTMGMTWEAAKLIGLEQLMLVMYDQPEQLHRLMAFLRDEHLHFITWLEREGLITAKNGNDYTGSGGVAYSHELPDAGAPGDAVRLRDIWGFAESQETVGVSPGMFADFILPYQAPLLETFGLNCYGCCEGLEHRIDSILRHVPRLRRVSVAPLANQESLAPKLLGRYIYSRKANPTPVCVNFDEAWIRKDLRHTLALAGRGPLEIILKDTHTVQHQPWRFDRWMRIAREEVDRYLATDAQR